MLKINLLPVRQLKKRAKARSQIMAALMMFIIAMCILGAIGFLQATKLSDIENNISRIQKEKKKFDPILKQMSELEKTKKDLENKISIIEKLKRDSSITVHILDEVATKVDSKRMWLNSLKQQDNGLSLTGVALDNKTIADFMDALKGSAYINDVNLSNASLTTVSGRNLKSFSLSCSIMTPGQENDKPAGSDNK